MLTRSCYVISSSDRTRPRCCMRRHPQSRLISPLRHGVISRPVGGNDFSRSCGMHQNYPPSGRSAHPMATLRCGASWQRRPMTLQGPNQPKTNLSGSTHVRREHSIQTCRDLVLLTSVSPCWWSAFHGLHHHHHQGNLEALRLPSHVHPCSGCHPPLPRISSTSTSLCTRVREGVRRSQSSR